TNARGCNVTATYRAYKKGALFANPCFTQIHPTCIPVSGEHQSKLTLMSESLRNDGRVWVPKRKEDCDKAPAEIPETERDYYLERKYPSYGNLAPRDISSRAAKEVCDEGRGVGPGGRGVYLDLADAIKRLGEQTICERYGNLFEIYGKITGENAYKMQMSKRPSTDHPEFKKAESDVRAKIDNLLKVNGKRSLDSIHRELGALLWEKCGMLRNKKGLQEALTKIPELRSEFWNNVRVPGD